MYLQEYQPPSLVPGKFDIADEGRFVRVTGEGLWTVPMIDAHCTAMSTILRSIRVVRGKAAVLVDLRRSVVQPAAVSAQLSLWTARSFTEQDRVAIVVGSSLLKTQARRMETPATRELFVSMNAAELWLCAGQTGMISEVA